MCCIKRKKKKTTKIPKAKETVRAREREGKKMKKKRVSVFRESKRDSDNYSRGGNNDEYSMRRWKFNFLFCSKQEIKYD